MPFHPLAWVILIVKISGTRYDNQNSENFSDSGLQFPISKIRKALDFKNASPALKFHKPRMQPR